MTTSALPVPVDELRALVVEELDLLSPADFDHCATVAARRQAPLMRAVAERAGVSYGQLLQHLSLQWQVEYVALRPADVDVRAMALLPEETARRLGVVVVARDGSGVRVAMKDPRDQAALADLRRRLGGGVVVPVLTDEVAIRRAWLLYRPELRDLMQRAGENRLPAPCPEPGRPEPSATQLLTLVLEYAVAAGASDIHIEPFEDDTIVRFRIDGALQEGLIVPSGLSLPLVARVKVLAQMRVDDRRSAQDGRLHADVGGLPVELRVSSLPTMWGEKAVLRVLARDPILLDLADIGLAPEDLDLVVRQVLQPHGMVLVTGPTGSGKTTSLYAFLMRIAGERQSVVNISTVEDPIEYTMPRVNQVPIRPEAGLDFSSGLRALLRQDPDIIMVGEIRDRETADLAVRSALVGRLLLSSLHTNDAASAVPRLLDMGVEPYLLASTLSLVVAQRLVRRICDHCRESRTADSRCLLALGGRDDWPAVLVGLRARGAIGADAADLADLRHFRGRGCARCHGTGFRGRLATFEVLAVNDRLRQQIARRADAAAIRAAALEDGLRPMIVDGLCKVLLGLTTIEEVLRATG